MEKIGDDFALDIKVMPDRAHYSLCHKGIAREIKAISGMMLNTQNINESKVDQKVQKVAVNVENKELCNRYMARRIDNVSIGDSPSSLTKLLETIGARAINNIVDATNYTMFDVGQPLHAFDADKVKGSIVVRKAKKGERIELLGVIPAENTTVAASDKSFASLPSGGLRRGEEGVFSAGNKTRVLELSDTDLIIADEAGPLALAGIKGGKRAEISASTKNIIIESANFNPVSIRRTSTRLNLRNDSSKRFENEIIPELAGDAMNRVTALILELSPSASVGPITDEWNKKTEKWTVNIPAQFIIDRVGIPVNEREVKEVIDRIDCEIAGRDGEMIVVPPLDRLDLKMPEDFADEVARIKGYDHMPSKMPPSLDKATPMDKAFYWAEKTKNILVGQGFSEVLLYSLASKGYYEIEHPLASDKNALRESIVPKIEESLKMNALNADLLGLETIRIFEIGKVFPNTGEKSVLALGVTQVKKQKGVTSESLLNETLQVLKKELGIAFDSKITKSGQGAVAELDFDAIVKQLPPAGSIASLNFQVLPKDKKYMPFSQYPFIVRDIAVFVPESVKSEEVWQVIFKSIQEKGAEKILTKNSLFDVFKKDGKVSYAFRMIFQSYDRTLKDEEVSGVMEAINSQLKAKGWEVR